MAVEHAQPVTRWRRGFHGVEGSAAAGCLTVAHARERPGARSLPASGSFSTRLFWRDWGGPSAAPKGIVYFFT